MERRESLPAEAHPSGEVRFGAAVYGSFLVASVVGVAFDAGESAAAMTTSLLGSMVVFWLAHAWSDVVGERISEGLTFRRREVLVEGLGVDPPEGTFYAWWRLPDGVTAERLLAEERVAVAPGEGFGARGGSYARLSLALDDAELEEGVARLAALAA